MIPFLATYIDQYIKSYSFFPLVTMTDRWKATKYNLKIQEKTFWAQNALNLGLTRNEKLWLITLAFSVCIRQLLLWHLCFDTLCMNDFLFLGKTTYFSACFLRAQAKAHRHPSLTFNESFARESSERFFVSIWCRNVLKRM